VKIPEISFVVVSVPWDPTPEIIKDLVKRGIPVLSETPPAPTLEALIDLYQSVGANAKIQIAEQYQYQPIHAARIHLANSGLLGKVTQTQMSVAHGYHGTCLMRKLLGINFENAEIIGRQFKSPIVSGPDRSGAPEREEVVESNQELAILSFQGKLGVFDFTGDQYFSWIRSNRVLVRGELGEIVNNEVCYLKDYKTPISVSLKRHNAGEDGNLEGFSHKGITLGDNWLYTNPFFLARLSDDEIAVATCLQKMWEYVNGGQEFYGLAEASQDHYLGMMIQQAIETKETLKTKTQIWAK
jgi:hypothetical protein